jgi:8-oxo-dGTP pyrophosphatase MutT (NUDIX family)
MRNTRNRTHPRRLEPNCALLFCAVLVQPIAGRLARMRKTKKYQDVPGPRQLVAAVCFRILSSGVEFLLVRTRRGRWTFPKGGAESGVTLAQSAAMEAYEEAGVHGRIEESSFGTYRLCRGNVATGGRTHDLVHAYLCEVLRQEPPEEPYRDPTWFSSEKTKLRLAQGRSAESATEFTQVIDRAVSRIRRQPARTLIANDPLLKIRFEASEMEFVGEIERVLPVATLEHASGLRRRQASTTRGRVLQLPSTELKQK